MTFGWKTRELHETLAVSMMKVMKVQIVTIVLSCKVPLVGVKAKSRGEGEGGGGGGGGGEGRGGEKTREREDESKG